MHRFYWVIDDVLAGCSRPGAHRGTVASDLAELRAWQVGALLTLTESPLDAVSVQQSGLRSLHIPVDDFHAPTTWQMLEALAFIDAARADSLPVAVHCLAGQGRTGTILAAYLLCSGIPANEAIAEIRTLCPGAIESTAQVAALEQWAIERPWLL